MSAATSGPHPLVRTWYETSVAPGVRGRPAGFAALLAVLLAASPATGAARWEASLVLGAFGGALALTLCRRRPADVAAPRIPLVLAPALLAFLLATAPTWLWLYGQYTASVWLNLHGLFVPLFMGLAASATLRRDPWPGREESSAWGFVWLVPALALLGVDAGVGSRLLSAVAIVLALPGISLLLLGARRTRALAFPLALGVFLVPLPESLGDPLGIVTGTAYLAEGLLGALGLDAVRIGTALHTRELVFEVSQNCSGVAALHAACAFAVLLGGLSGRRRIALLLVALLLTPLVNTLRIAALIGIASWSRPLAESALHGLSGLAVFWGVIGVLWLLADRRAVRERLA